VVVGGSFLGTELAAALVGLGLEVTMILLEDVPLERHYGRAAGAWFGRLLEARGVRVLAAESLAAFEPAREGGERVGAVRTASGARLEADLVTVAAGAVPDVMLARGSGLELGELGGVRCDAGLRTSAPGVFAAGDMCEWDSVLHGGAARVEHWEVALEHGRTVARNMLGEDVAHDVVPYFWSDIGDWATSEYVGVAADGGWDDEVVRGSMADGRFSVWHLLGGRVVSALSVGRPQDLDEARRLIRSREVVRADALAGGS
jgi:3-phenylpropionate/trans-cinnamate dioxygenase ferredoxin reductase subunit